MRTIRNDSFENKRVIIRADLDVTIENGIISDDYRLKAIQPSLEYLLAANPKQIVIIGHLGRPDKQQPDKTLAPIANCLSEFIKTRISFIPYQPNLSETHIDPNDKIVMLENLKFWEGETANDLTFAQSLAGFGDIYVNESFATSHQDYASIVTLPTLLPAYAGFQLELEVNQLQNFWITSKRPIVFLLGGAKKDKLDSIIGMSKKADLTLVSGVFVNEKMLGINPNIIYAPDMIDDSDIGPESIQIFSQHLNTAATVLWNGPVGIFEQPQYEKGTQMITVKLADLTQNKQLITVVGGGNTVSALKKYHALEKMSFVSTGGGAMLELLAEGTLPGIEALNKV